MGKYDIGSRYDGHQKIGLSDLSHEIALETVKHESWRNFLHEKDSIRHVLFNTNGSGLVQRFRKTGIDLWKDTNGDKQNQFDALKILKFLYCMELRTSQEGKRVNMIQVLSRPRLGNVNTGYTNSTAYGEEFNSIFYCIRGQVDHPEEYEHEVEEMDGNWRGLIDSLTRFLYRADVVPDGSIMLPKLKGISHCLTMLSETADETDSALFSDGVMKQFFLLLLRHKILACILEMEQSAGREAAIETEYDAGLARGYLNEFTGNFDSIITWGQIDNVVKELRDYDKRRLNLDSFDPDYYNYKTEWMDKESAQKLAYLMCACGHLDWASWQLIGAVLGTVAGKDLTSGENKRHRINAFLYTRNVAEWFIRKYEVDYQDGIPFHVLAGIAQTIYLISLNKEQYRNDYYGSRPATRSLLAAIKDADQADATAIMDIENRVTNRILVILAGAEMTEAYRAVEKSLLEMEEHVFSQTTMQNMKREHQRLYPKAEEIICELANSSCTGEGISFSLF